MELVDPTSPVTVPYGKIWESVSNINENYNPDYDELSHDIIDTKYCAEDLSQADVVLWKPNLLCFHYNKYQAL